MISEIYYSPVYSGVSKQLNLSDFGFKNSNIQCLKRFLNKNSELKENNQSSDLFRNMDKSFYTKSMDLSDKDFDIDLDSDVVKHRKTKLAVKIILTIILLLLVAALVYFLVKGI